MRESTERFFAGLLSDGSHRQRFAYASGGTDGGRAERRSPVFAS